MSENDSMDHWEQLASELGTEPPPKGSEEQPGSHDEGRLWAENSTEAELSAQLPLSSSPPKKRMPPPDWGAIASALGIMTAPEVNEPSPASGRGDAPTEEEDGTAEFIEEARQELEAGEEQEEAEAQEEEAIERQGPQPELPEEPFGFGLIPAEEEPLAPADVDAVEPPTAEEEEREEEEGAIEPVAESPDKGPSRRRRRRRRKPRLGEKAGDGPDVELEEDESGETVAGDVDTEEAESVEPEEEERAEDELRGKRRRKRRSAKRKKKGDAEPVGAASGPSEDGTAEAREEEDTSEKSDRDEAARRSRKGDKQKPSHRAIPTWSEAIGLIITGNLERRKKSGGGSGRGRGRGRGRKGRSSSEGKSSSRR
jgi:hypothetical protein